MKLSFTQVSAYTGIFFSSDLPYGIFQITDLALYLGTAYKFALKKDKSFIELMTCCHQRVFFTSPLKR